MISETDPRYLQFPDVNAADDDGFLAHGGNLAADTLISAYQQGIFPWFNEDQPILWWSPDPRLILRTDAMKCSRSLRKQIRRKIFRVSCDEAFEKVIDACAAPRSNQRGDTWLSKRMREAYQTLHQLEYAHSIECWHGQKLVGGLYGISIQGCFFGESMFSTTSDASKVALYYLCRFLNQQGVSWIDCQVASDHLLSLGAELIPRQQFIADIKTSLKISSPIAWHQFAESIE